VAEAGVAPGFNFGFVQGLGVSSRATTAFENQPFSVALQKSLLERGVAYGLGDRVNPRGGELKIILQPEDAFAVDGLLSDVQEWRQAGLAFLKGLGDPEMPEGVSKVEADYLRLLHTWGIRSIEEGTITRDDATVVLDCARRIMPEERAIVREMEKLNSRRAARGAELVRLLMDGEDPPASLFEGIASDDFAEDVAKSRR